MHCCRLDAETKSSQLTEVSASKASLEEELASLNENHKALIQQHEQLKEDISGVQISLRAAEEGKASAEVCSFWTLCMQDQHMQMNVPCNLDVYFVPRHNHMDETNAR